MVLKPVTLKYPFQPIEAPEGFRGRPVIDARLCIGCGACARACPPNAIEVVDDVERGVRLVKIFYARCIFCARCEEVCPEHAIKLTREFELATNNKEDLYYIVELKLARCVKCGKVLDRTERQIEKALMTIPEDVESVSEFVRMCEDCRVKAVKEAGRLSLGLGVVEDAREV